MAQNMLFFQPTAIFFKGSRCVSHAFPRWAFYMARRLKEQKRFQETEDLLRWAVDGLRTEIGEKVVPRQGEVFMELKSYDSHVSYGKSFIMVDNIIVKLIPIYIYNYIYIYIYE